MSLILKKQFQFSGLLLTTEAMGTGGLLEHSLS
jgi:hypothetical protein